jgi:hypothetical protein
MSKGERLRAARAATKADDEAQAALKKRIMSADFSRKLDRAEAHIDTLEDSIHRWLESDAYSLVENLNAQTGEYVLEAKLTKPPCDSWPLLIGDAVHNLRSALDHIAYTLALNGYQIQNPGAMIPPNHQKRIQFPIVATSNDPARNVEQFYAQVIIGQLRYVPGPAATCIESLQPYKRSPTDPASDPLWIVNELDVIDKHRKLHAVAVANPVQGFSIGQGGGTVEIKDMEISGGTVESDRVLMRFTIGSQTTMPLHMERQFARYVALADGPVGATTGEVVSILRGLVENVKNTVVRELTQFL